MITAVLWCAIYAVIKLQHALIHVTISSLAMASGVVKGAIAAVVDKTPSKSGRSCKLRKLAQDILEKSCEGEAQLEAFDKFSKEIVDFLKQLVLSVSGKYRLKSAKREHLWREQEQGCYLSYGDG